MLRLTFALLISFFHAIGFAQDNKSQVYIKVGEAKAEKSRVAFPDLQFYGNPTTTPNASLLKSELKTTIVNDLQVTGFFQFLPEKSFLEDTTNKGLRPLGQEANGFQFESWQQLKAEFLIRGGISVAGESLTLEIYVYHVPKSELIFGKKYKGVVKGARRMAHIFSNDVMEALTGKTGMFLSKIVVASDRGGDNTKEIYTMDWDGENVSRATNHRSVALSPSWSPDGKKIAYTAFVMRAKSKIRNADLFVYELDSQSRWLVSYRKGINSGSNWDPNNKYIYLTISQEGNPDIFKMTVEGELVKKLTNGPVGAMNVEPAISPDGSKIAFSSDRSGRPMIYVMNSDGTNVKRVTFAGSFNATPAWSPDGKRIAFAGWESDHFDIFTMNADGSDMKRITSAKKKNGKWSRNESPSFSPDGRLLMYTSDRTGFNQIYISTLDGSEEWQVTRDQHNYFSPKWSKNIE